MFPLTVEVDRQIAAAEAGLAELRATRDRLLAEAQGPAVRRAVAVAFMERDQEDHFYDVIARFLANTPGARLEGNGGMTIVELVLDAATPDVAIATGTARMLEADLDSDGRPCGCFLEWDLRTYHETALLDEDVVYADEDEALEAVEILRTEGVIYWRDFLEAHS